MRAVGLVLALAIVASGCRTMGGKLGGTLAGTGAVFGLIMIPLCAGAGCSSSGNDEVRVITLGAIVSGVAIAIVSEASYKPPVVTDPVSASVQAQQLTAEAQQAALHGQCAALPALAQRVNALDAEYYTRVFYTDPGIQRCMSLP